jgi:hypothetical protein
MQPQATGSSGYVALELSFELDFVTERDTVFADRSDRRLYAARVVDRTGAHDHHSKATALIKSQCVKIIVGGGYPQEAHTLGSQARDKKFELIRSPQLIDLGQGTKILYLVRLPTGITMQLFGQNLSYAGRCFGCR